MEKRVRYSEAVVRSSRVLAWVVLVGAAGCTVEPEPDATTRVQGAVTTLPSVVTQHNDLGRTGANLNETILTPSLVGTKGKFGKLGKLPVDGQIYGQPLYVPGIIGGKNAVFVATETGYSVELVPWSAEASYRMPVAVWQDVVNDHFPGSAWLRCRRDTLDALFAYKTEHALPTWDATLSALLAAVPGTEAP